MTDGGNTPRFAIHYAFPTSTAAEDLGRGKDGCYFVARIDKHRDGCDKPPEIACGPYQTRQQARTGLANLLTPEEFK